MFNKKELIKIRKQIDTIVEKLTNRLKIIENLDKNHYIFPFNWKLTDYDIINDDIIFIFICYNETSDNIYEYDLTIPFKIYNNDKLFVKWCKDKIKQEKRKIKEIREREILAGIIRPNVEKMIDKATEIVENQYISN